MRGTSLDRGDINDRVMRWQESDTLIPGFLFGEGFQRSRRLMV
jgi:hypothetical protein